MPAIGFLTPIGPDRLVTIRSEFADRLEADQVGRVIVGIADDERSGDRAWPRSSSEQLLSAYADADAVYDDLDRSSP